MAMNVPLLGTLASKAIDVRRSLLEDGQEPEPVLAFSIDQSDLESAPARTPDGKSAPAMRGVTHIRSHDGRVTSGVWDCAAGAFEVQFFCDEVVHILEGEVITRTNGSVRILRPGDVALFRAGITSTWDVPRYVRKLWFHHHARPTIWDRVKYKLMLLQNHLLARATSDGAKDAPYGTR